MKSKPSHSLAVALAGLLSLVAASSCGAQTSKEEKLRSYMESTPFVAPMGYEDYTDPQIGYTHSPGGIDGGSFLLVNAGDYKSADQSSPKPIEFKKLASMGLLSLIWRLDSSRERQRVSMASKSRGSGTV